MSRLEVHMALKTKAYIGLAIASGAALLVHDLSRWASQDPGRFVCYLLVAAIASGLKVRLPAITGTLSVNFLFILIGIAELTRPETLVSLIAVLFIKEIPLRRTVAKLDEPIDLD